MEVLINELSYGQILLEEAIGEFEKLYIEKALERNIGHVSKTASALGASTEIRSQRRISSYKSPAPAKKRSANGKV